MKEPITPEEFLEDFTICVTHAETKDKDSRFQLFMSLKNKDWAMTKTLPQFNQLFEQLEARTYDIGLIQQRIHFKQVPIEDLKRQINIQMQRLAARKDVIQNQAWIKFLHINNFVTFKESPVTQTDVVQTKTKLNVKDFFYSIESDTLFCLEVQQKFTQKISTMLKSLFTQSNTPIAQLSLYWKKELQWRIELFFKCTCFHWNQKSTMLIVATARSINIYRVSVEKQYQYDAFSTIDMGGRPEVISIFMSPYNGHIYALTSKSFIIINMNTNKIIAEMPSNHQNTAMLFNQETETLYVAKYPSYIFIFKVEADTPVPTLIAHFKSETPSKITCLELSADKSYLLGLNSEGAVMIFEILRGKQKLSQHISSISIPTLSTSMSFCQKLKLLFVNYKNNVISVNSTNVQQCSIPFGSRVVKVKYCYPQGLLVVADENGVITFMQYLPERQEEPDLPIRKKMPKFEEKDSDDEIDGWANDDPN